MMFEINNPGKTVSELEEQTSRTIRIRVVDLETTGLTATEHAPCEVGCVDLETANLGDERVWSCARNEKVSGLCNPQRLMPPEASAIHHIVDDDVMDTKDWKTALRELAAHRPEADIYAAHNAKFEQLWITQDYTQDKPWICTYKCALRLWPDAPGHSNQTLRYWRNLIQIEAVPHIRAFANQTHRALPDAYVTSWLLREMLKETSLEQLIAWSNEPALLPRIHFGQHRGKKWSEIESGFLNWVLARDFDEDVMHTARTELERRRAQCGND